MKNLKFMTFLLVMLATQFTFAQGTSKLKLSNLYPEKGEKLTFTYDSAGTPLAGAPGKIEATVHFVEGMGNPSTPVTLQAEGKTFKGEFTVSADAKAFFIKINIGKIIDQNGGNGYISIIYKEQKPVEGAYASNAYILMSGMGTVLANIPRNPDAAVELYKKEFALYPKSEKLYEQSYYTALSQNQANAALVNKKIAELKASNEEKDLIFANILLRNSGKTASADSLLQTVKERFPSGVVAVSDARTAIAKEKDFAKKHALFADFITKHPDLSTQSKDGLITTMLSVYLQNKDMANYNKYVAQLTNKEPLPIILNNVAYGWGVAGQNLEEAEKLSKQSIDIILSNAGVLTPQELKESQIGLYYMAADSYAYILFKEKKYAEALQYQEFVYNRTNGGNMEITEHYVQILNNVGKYEQAKNIAAENIAKGKTSAVLEEELKTAYVKLKGSDAGFAAYSAEVQKFNIAKKETEKREFLAEQAAILARQSSASTLAQVALVKKGLSAKIINEAAPLFTLKDMDGKTVSLASLKGKTVIIDFWATWCGPCIMSFPGMQIAQNKYKNNPDIVFLFINTWERSENFLPGVKKFVANSYYDFHVLLDEMGTDKKQSKVISTYKVEGIPTKFIIDKNGDIRFKYVGYSGSTEAVVNEVTAMIELLNEPVAKTKIATPGTSTTGGAAPSVNK